MKNTIKTLLLSVCIAALLSSCTKNENQIYFEGGTAPVLTSSVSGSIPLFSLNKDKEAVKLEWTNPNYNFSTGVSSQDVSYTVQIDTAGAHFTNPLKQEFSVAKNLNFTLTVGALNTYLNKMLSQTDVPHDVEVRVVSNLTSAVPLQSNVIKFTGVVPYEDFAVPPPATQELYITGDATPSSWTNEPPVSQKCTRVDKANYYIIMSFAPGKFYKFLSNQKQWQPQYGGTSNSGGDIGFNLGSGSDPAAIPTPAGEGSYKVELNFKTGKYTVTKQ